MVGVSPFAAWLAFICFHLGHSWLKCDWIAFHAMSVKSHKAAYVSLLLLAWQVWQSIEVP